MLSAGYVHMDAGTPNDMYVWPYFFAVPLDRLTAPQRVELFKIVTAGDYEDMKTYGTYIFYRVGITPDGRWSFFVAGIRPAASALDLRQSMTRSASENSTGSPSAASTISPSHMTRRPRTIVPTGQPVTCLPS